MISSKQPNDFKRWLPESPDIAGLIHPPQLSDFKLFSVIQKDSWGNTFSVALKKKTDTPYMLRIHSKERIKEMGDEEEVKQQIYFLQRIEHRNILGFITWFEDPKKIYFLTKMVQRKSLTSLFKTFDKIKESKVASYFSGVFRALHYLFLTHDEANYLGISLNNIYISSSENETILDLCLYKKEQGVRFHLYEKNETKKHLENEKKSVFEMSKLLYQALTGVQYNTRSPSKGNMPDCPSHLSSEVRELLYGMLNPDIKKRYNYTEVLSSSWFSKYKLKYNEIRDSPLILTELRKKIRSLKMVNEMKEKRLVEAQKKEKERNKLLKEQELKIKHLKSLLVLNDINDGGIDIGEDLEEMEIGSFQVIEDGQEDDKKHTPEEKPLKTKEVANSRKSTIDSAFDGQGVSNVLEEEVEEEEFSLL